VAALLCMNRFYCYASRQRQ